MSSGYLICGCLLIFSDRGRSWPLFVLVKLTVCKFWEGILELKI